MKLRAPLLVSVLAIALILPFSVVALASPAPTPPAAPADAPTITATGIGITAITGNEIVLSPQTLNISAQSKAAAADIETAVTEMQSRLASIKAALVKVGVPAAGIRFQAMNVQPQYGPPAPGAPSPVEKGQPLPQQVLSFVILANMAAEVPEPKILVPAINAATSNGATTVNSFLGKGGQPNPPQPAADVLAQLATDALANARAAAEAMALASGKRLGALRSVTSQQIYPDCCPQGSGWRMTLTATFEIAQ